MSESTRITLQRLVTEAVKHTAAAKAAATPAAAEQHIKAIAAYVVVVQDCGVTAPEFNAMVAAAGGAQ